MKSTAIYGLLSLFLFIGCTEHSVAPDRPSGRKEIYPLATGDVRIYVDTLFFSDGSVAEVAFDTEWVGMPVSIKNEIWYVISSNQNSRGDLYTNRPNGYWNDFSNQLFLVYKYPATSGEIYGEHSDTLFIDKTHFQVDHHYTRIASTDTPISIGDSTYFCYDYQSFLYTFTDVDTGYHRPWYETYVCPGIGKIYVQDTFDRTWTKDGTRVDYGTESITLVKYLLK